MMRVTEQMKSDLLTSAKWAKFLAILSCIGVGIIVLMAVCMMVMGNTLSEFGSYGKGAGLGFGLIYLVIAALYIYPLMRAFNFCSATKRACMLNDEVALGDAFAAQRSLLRYCGILALCFIAIYLIVIIGACIVGVAAAM